MKTFDDPLYARAYCSRLCHLECDLRNPRSKIMKMFQKPRFCKKMTKIVKLSPFLPKIDAFWRSPERNTSLRGFRRSLFAPAAG